MSCHIISYQHSSFINALITSHQYTNAINIISSSYQYTYHITHYPIFPLFKSTLSSYFLNPHPITLPPLNLPYQSTHPLFLPLSPLPPQTSSSLESVMADHLVRPLLPIVHALCAAQVTITQSLTPTNNNPNPHPNQHQPTQHIPPQCTVAPPSSRIILPLITSPPLSLITMFRPPPPLPPLAPLSSLRTSTKSC